MRTTVDLPEDLLRAAKERALRRRESLSRLVQQALDAHLREDEREGDEEFELLVRGEPGGRFPSPAQVYELLDEDDRGDS